MAYNGYANYETWNVCLWLRNDEGLYRAMRDAVRKHTGRLTGDHAAQLVRALLPNGTGDTNDLHRVRWAEVAQFLRELRGDS